MKNRAYKRHGRWLAPWLFLLLILVPTVVLAAPVYISLSVDKCKFRPESLKMKQGQEYAVVLQGKSALGPHDFTMEDKGGALGMSQVFNSDYVQIYRVMPTQAGKYNFFCNRNMPFYGADEVVKGRGGILEVTP